MKKRFYSNPSNAEIYEGLLENDSGVFIYLKEKILPALINNTSRWYLYPVLSRQDIEDCLQSIFCEIVESIQKSDDRLKAILSKDEYPFVSYLIEKCKYRLLRKSRQDKINNNAIKRLSVESSIESTEETIINQEEIEFNQHLYKYIFNTLENTHNLEIIRLKYWGNLKYSEIAHRLNYKDPASARAALSHTINYIRKQLVEEIQLNLPNNINREKSTSIQSILLRVKENLLLPVAGISKSIFSDKGVSCTLFTPSVLPPAERYQK